ncbi:3-isopropylmalate dehydratase small subunit [Candidatus Bathyarchaeota archaeon]|nr:3-isopropylmalate dehydratase small subunit [Candidatus Bathyarchaeota archaeon]
MQNSKAWNFGDNVNTDFILPGRYLELTDPKKLAEHAMEGLDPTFSSNVKKGDIIIGGKNFGLGSSREHAPIALKYSGINIIVAESFARIFYRNAFNIGIAAIECQNISHKVKTGDNIEVNLAKGKILVHGEKLSIKPLPEFMLQLLNEGGLVNYIKNHIKEW